MISEKRIYIMNVPAAENGLIQITFISAKAMETLLMKYMRNGYVC